MSAFICAITRVLTRARPRYGLRPHVVTLNQARFSANPPVAQFVSVSLLTQGFNEAVGQADKINPGPCDNLTVLSGRHCLGVIFDSTLLSIAVLRGGPRGQAVAIYRLLQGKALDQEDIRRVSDAYEAALKTLQTSNRHDPITETVAKQIFAVWQTGVRDPAKICAIALEQLRLP